MDGRFAVDFPFVVAFLADELPLAFMPDLVALFLRLLDAALVAFDFFEIPTAFAPVLTLFAATRLDDRTRNVCPMTTRFDLMPLSDFSRVALMPYFLAMPANDSPRRTTCTP